MRNIRNLSIEARALVAKVRNLLSGVKKKELEELAKWVEESTEILQKEDAINKAMILLNAGVKVVNLVSPLIELIEGDEDSSDVPSWVAVLVPLVRKLHTLTNDEDG